jgi:hypothetical protein
MPVGAKTVMLLDNDLGYLGYSTLGSSLHLFINEFEPT